MTRLEQLTLVINQILSLAVATLKASSYTALP